MSKNTINESLSHLTKDMLMDRVDSVALVYITKNGDVKSAFYTTNTADVFALTGATEMLKTRIIHGTMNVPEANNDNS